MTPHSPSRKTSANVLVLGDDMRIFLAVVRALGRAGIRVHACPLNRQAPALRSRYITRILDLPLYEAGPEAWAAAVRRHAISEAVDLVIPCSDQFIMMLHQQRDPLRDVRLAIPRPDAIEYLFDKASTHALCDRLGIPVAPFSRLDATTTADQLLAGHKLPFVLKPRRSYWLDRPGHWGRVHIVTTRDQLTDVLSDIVDRERYLLEGFFEGKGCGISVLANDGEILQAFQHRRLREGLGAASSYRISEAIDAAMYASCEKIMRAMRHTGVCMFEFRRNEDTGKWILLETNARFWGSVPLPLALGVNFPVLLFDLMVSDERHPSAHYEVGIRSRNITLDGFNLLKMIPGLRLGTLVGWALGLADYAAQPLRWLTRREFNDSFAADDMAPGFAEIVAILKGRK